MLYDELSTKSASRVEVEWIDICCDQGGVGLSRRWTLGYLLDREYESEGLPCLVLAQTWDEDGWADYYTIPHVVVVSVEEI